MIRSTGQGKAAQPVDVEHTPEKHVVDGIPRLVPSEEDIKSTRNRFTSSGYSVLKYVNSFESDRISLGTPSTTIVRWCADFLFRKVCRRLV